MIFLSFLAGITAGLVLVAILSARPGHAFYMAGVKFGLWLVSAILMAFVLWVWITLVLST